MANVFYAHSFDWYATANFNAMGWTAVASAGAVSYAIGNFGREGTQGLELARNTNANSGAIASAKRTYTAAQTVINGVAFYTDKFPVAGSKRLIAQVLDSATSQIDFYLLPTGAIQAESNAVVLGVSTAGLDVATYYFIEYKTKIANVGGTVDLYLDSGNFESVNILSLTAKDTQVSGNASSNGFALCHKASDVTDISKNWFDDFYHTDPSDDVYPAPVGNLHGMAERPNGSGFYSDLIPIGVAVDYQAVNEQFEDEDATYIVTMGTDVQSTFPHTVVPINSDVLAVVLTHVSRLTTGTKNVAPEWRIAGTDYLGTPVVITGTYAAYQQSYTKSPKTGVLWITPELNAAEIGEKVL